MNTMDVRESAFMNQITCIVHDVLCEGKDCLELVLFGSPNFKGVWKGCAWGLFGGNLV